MKKLLGLVFILMTLTACSDKVVKEQATTSETSRIETISSSTSQSVEATEQSSSHVLKKFESGMLLQAVGNNDVNQVKEILSDYDYIVDEQNEKGETPLVIATHNNQVEIAKVLVDAGSDVNKQDTIQDSAYLYAAAQGKTEILAYILQHATPNQTVYNRFGGNAIIPAAEKGHLENVKMLINDGKVGINHQNDSGYTALIEAVALRDGSKVYQDIVSELLKAGADKTLRDNSGRTAEDYASQLGYETILKQLQQS